LEKERNNNFWQDRANLKLIEPFKSLYEKDKTKSKAKSSKIMHALDLYCNPESEVYNIPDKAELLANDYIKDKDFKWEDYEEHLTLYSQTVLTPAEQEFHEWNEMMRERKKMIREMLREEMAKDAGERDLRVIEALDKFMANTAKLFNDYLKIKKEFDEDKLKDNGRAEYLDDI
jgi:hypothetical protein